LPLPRGATPKAGSVLADEVLPPHSSVEELAALAGNHVTKEGKQWAAASGAMCAAVESKLDLGLSANTAEETKAELAAIGSDRHRCYTDGGCDENGAGGVWGASGWGLHVLGVPPPAVRAEIWGPVVIDDDSICTILPYIRGTPESHDTSKEVLVYGSREKRVTVPSSIDFTFTCRHSIDHSCTTLSLTLNWH
jgi:hypothetical protein